MTTKEITFEAIPSGDHELFCWDVTKEEYIRIIGHEPEKDTYHGGELEFDSSFFNPGMYRIYPGDEIPYPYPNAQEKVKVTIKVEDEGNKRTFAITTEPI